MAINDLDELNDIDLRQMMTCASGPNAEKHNCEECRYCMDLDRENGRMLCDVCGYTMGWSPDKKSDCPSFEPPVSIL